MKRRRKSKLETDLGVMERARILCDIPTQTIIEALSSGQFNSRSCRVFKALMTLELSYRVRQRGYTQYLTILEDIFGKDVPRNLCPPSDYHPTERRWVELDAQVH